MAISFTGWSIRNIDMAVLTTSEHLITFPFGTPCLGIQMFWIVNASVVYDFESMILVLRPLLLCR